MGVDPSLTPGRGLNPQLWPPCCFFSSGGIPLLFSSGCRWNSLQEFHFFPWTVSVFWIFTSKTLWGGDQQMFLWLHWSKRTLPGHSCRRSYMDKPLLTVFLPISFTVFSWNSASFHKSSTWAFAHIFIDHFSLASPLESLLLMANNILQYICIIYTLILWSL